VEIDINDVTENNNFRSLRRMHQ